MTHTFMGSFWCEFVIPLTAQNRPEVTEILVKEPLRYCNDDGKVTVLLGKYTFDEY